MRDFIFLWSQRNTQHIAKHDVSPEEAEHVVGHAQPPWPQNAAGEKRAVWGQTRDGRYLQVIFVHSLAEDIESDEYDALSLHERIALDLGEPAVRIIHARDLTEGEKQRFRRRKRGRR